MSIFGKKNNPKENENNAAEEAKATPAAEEKEETADRAFKAILSGP